MESTRICFLDQPLFQIFLNLKDSRVGGRCLHPLTNIIFITICALVSGANNWKTIEAFGNRRRRWLSQFINLKNGIPSHFTFARVLSMMDPDLFEKCVRQWINGAYRLLDLDSRP